MEKEKALTLREMSLAQKNGHQVEFLKYAESLEGDLAALSGRAEILRKRINHWEMAISLASDRSQFPEMSTEINRARKEMFSLGRMAAELGQCINAIRAIGRSNGNGHHGSVKKTGDPPANTDPPPS